MMPNTMTIERDAPLCAEREARINRPVDRVWSELTTIEKWPEWQTSISSVAVEGPLAVGTEFRWKANGLGIVSTVEVLEPGHRIGWSGLSLGMRAVHLWELRPEDEGTRVITQESLSGWLARLLSFFDREYLDKSLDSALAELKSRAERA